jgi:hypothetical protein
MQHSKMTVGSMTMAMKAVRSEGRGAKVLRLGVLEGSRIVEERIVRADEKAPVTIGTDPSCTIVIAGEAAPEKQALFVRESDRWTLALSAGLEGRVLIDSKVHAVAALAAQCSSIALDANTRGKVSLGATSVLFQFVEAPPVAPKPQLPRTIVRQPLRELDWRYNACLSGFMALAFIGMGYVEYGYDPEIEAMDIGEEARLVRVDSAPMSPEAMPTEQQQAAAAPETPSRPSHQPSRATSNTRNQSTAQHNGATSSETQAQRVNAAMNRAMSAADAAMTALNRSAEWRDLLHATEGPRSAAAMVANGQGLSDGSVEALGTVGNVTNATDRPGIHRTALVASNTPIGANTLGGPRRIDGPGEIATNTVVPVERPVSTRVTTSGPIGPEPGPGMPMNEIAAVFRRNLGAIQSCYTAGLRNNSGLRGRLEVEFTIGTSGRVVGTPSVSGLANGDDVHQCVAQRVRRYVFPQLREASDVMFPVVLEPGG